MGQGRDTVRDKLETMWFFHRAVVVRFLVADAIALVLLSLIVGDSTDMLPAYSVPCLSILNYFLTNRRYKPVQFELPLVLLVAFAFSTFIAFVNCISSRTNHANSSFGLLISVIFLLLFGLVTTCVAFATYLLWSEDEMDSQVRRHHLRSRR